MTDVWQILRDGGLPLALPRSGNRPTIEQLATALRTAIDSEPRGRDADALAAFAAAWSQHWPTSFAHACDERVLEVEAWIRNHTPDRNRYLKLRRIAIENLATIL